MLWIPINRELNISLKKQIYQYLRDQILSGELKSGMKLPATRELAIHIGVSRNSIIEAYEQLLAEGYLEGRQGAGTYVSEGAFLGKSEKVNINEIDLRDHKVSCSDDVIDFRSGVPALDMFPKINGVN